MRQDIEPPSLIIDLQVAWAKIELPVPLTQAGLVQGKRGQSHDLQPVWFPAYRFSFFPIYFAFSCLVAYKLDLGLFRCKTHMFGCVVV